MKSQLYKEVSCVLLSQSPAGNPEKVEPFPLEGCSVIQIGEQTLNSQEAEAEGRRMSSRAGLCGLGQGRWDRLKKNTAVNI